jgi:MFS family permease
MIEWIRAHDEILTWLAVLSAATFVLSLIAIPFLVARIPADYFSERRRRRRRRPDGPAWTRIVLIVVKNALGVVFIAAGIAMLFLPGQGLLMILIGVLLTNFPGKYRLERAIVRRPAIYRAINWIRRRTGNPELEHPDGAIGATAAEKAR